MKFIDEALISVQAGNGGNGVVRFRQEKFVPKGGPDGGDGGNGGDVIFRASVHLTTLLDFRYKRKYSAENGAPGESSNRTGRSADDLVISVPIGTIVYDADTKEIICDLKENAQEFIVAHGGKGGHGNARFATAQNQAPRKATPGKPGEERSLALELKLLADVGIVGLPNVGKSTFIATVSAAKPKIADYPFTTLVPNLGVVRRGDETLVVADIPGLIRGAHEGAGLGIRFLKHVERCRALCHLVDSSSEGDAEADVAAIEEELRAFSPGIAARPQVLVASKIDAADPARLASIEQAARRRGLAFFGVSAAAGTGLPALVHALFEVGKPGHEP